MDFNVDAARKAGYSDSEIAAFLAQSNPKFDYNGAKKAGYSDTEIVDHLNSSQQYNGIFRKPAIAASGLAQGVLDAGGLPGSLAQTMNKYVAAPVARAIAPAFGLEPGAVTDDASAGLVTVPEVENDATQKGIINRPDLAPQNATERYTKAISRGVGGIAPFALAGPAGLLATQGAGAGAAGQAAEDANLSPRMQFLASLAGGMGAGGALNLGARAARAAAGDFTPTAAAYKEAGITPKLAGNITDSPGMKWIQQRAAESPLTMGKMKNAANSEISDFSDAAEKIASKYGTSQTLQDAGSALQANFDKWLTDFKNQSGQKWGKVDNLIGKSTPAYMPNTQQVLYGIKGSAPLNPSAQSFLTSPLAKQIDGIVSDTMGSNSPNPYMIQGINSPQENPLTWDTLKQIRSRVGEYLENPQTISDAGTAQAKQLYGALSRDMENTINFLPTNYAGRDKVIQAFKEANAYTANGHDFIDNVGSNIQNAKPEEAARFALSQSKLGGTNLQAIRQNLPDGADELAAYTIRDAKMAQPGAQNAAGDRVSPARWLTQMGPRGKLSPEVQTALFDDPDDQAAISNLNTVASSMKDTEALANTSKTASANTIGNMVTGAEGGAAAGYAFGGTPGAILGAAGGAALPVVSPAALAKLATSPSVIKVMSGSPVAPLSYPAALPTGVSAYGLTPAQQ